MKPLITAFLLTLTIPTYSQSDMTVSADRSSPSPDDRTVTAEMPDVADESIIKIDYSLPDGIILHGTKMVIVKKGVMRLLPKQVLLPNGTRVTSDGYVYRKNKPKMLLNYGEYIDPSGKIIPMGIINSIN